MHQRWLIVALVLTLALRIAIVLTWHVPGGDGLQYWRLANTLRAEGRFAYSAGAEPAWSRLPGYPILNAYALSWSPLPLEQHLVRATLANVLFDFGTALLVYMLLTRLGVGPRGRWAGVFLTLLFPSLIMLCSFALTETFATFMDTLELVLILLAMERRSIGWAALAGAVGGAAQLVRADAITVSVALMMAAWLLVNDWRERGKLVGVFALGWILVFGMWPWRNLTRFGELHLAASTWRTMEGTPLPDGPIIWARTWSASRPGETWMDFAMANRQPMEPSRTILPTMYSDEGERQAVAKVFTHYNRDGLTGKVDDEFRELARERFRAHPFTALVTLPLGRIYRLWTPPPPWEIPLKVRWLGQPQARPVLEVLQWFVTILGLAGVYLGLSRSHPRRRLALVLASVLAARTALFSFMIPHGTNGRYFVEAVPILVVFAVLAAEDLVGRLTRRSPQQPSPPRGGLKPIGDPARV
jgi:hypothetical protein